jgi:hypothetical protein
VGLLKGQWAFVLDTSFNPSCDVTHFDIPSMQPRSSTDTNQEEQKNQTQGNAQQPQQYQDHD